MILALFDFDGTITRQDSFIDFLKFTVEPRLFYSGLIRVFPRLLFLWIRIGSVSQVKQFLISYYFKNWTVQRFGDAGNKYACDRLPNIIRPWMIKRINDHLLLHHRVIVVSASLSEWLAGWSSARGVELISSRLEVRDGFLTGQFEGTDCQGKEKVRRIQKCVDLNLAEYIYAYGNSSHDQEMLNLANEAYWIKNATPPSWSSL